MNELQNYNEQIIEQRIGEPEMPRDNMAPGVGEMIKGIIGRWYIILLVFILITAAGLPAIWYFINPLYTVTGAIKVAPILPNPLTGEPDKGDIGNYESFMYTQAEVMKSDRVIQRVADMLHEEHLDFLEKPSTDIVAKMKQKITNRESNPDAASLLRSALSGGKISIGPARRSNYLRINMESANRSEAARIVNAFIEAYMAIEGDVSNQKENRKLNLLQEERKTLLAKLKRQRATLRHLAQEYGTVDMSSRYDIKLESVANLQNELIKTEAQRIKLETQVKLLEKKPEKAVDPHEIVEMKKEYINSDIAVKQLNQKILNLREQLIVAKQELAPQNPALEQKRKLLEAFESELQEKRQEVSKEFTDTIAAASGKAGKEELQNAHAQLQQVNAYENRLRQVLSEQDTQTRTIGRRQLDIGDVQFQLDLDKDMYDTICRRIQELEMQRKRPARVSIGYRAQLAHTRDKRMKYSAALLFFAMASGMGLAYLRDKSDTRLRTPDDVTKRIGIRILGTTTSPQSVRRKLLPQKVIEDYQTIRANLGLLNGQGMPHKLAVTSPGPRDGKTTFAVNLATSLAKAGKKVLLIDGDLRKPDIAHLMRLPRGSRELQDFLLGQNSKQVVVSIESSGLDVLPADSRNRNDAYELLALPNTAQRINEFVRNYDHVIIDTPPVLAFPDPLIWARIAGSVVLTSLSGRTMASDLKKAETKLSEIKTRILGTVLTNVPAEHSYYRYGYSYYTQSGSQRKWRPKTNTKLLMPIQSKKKDKKKS